MGIKTMWGEKIKPLYKKQTFQDQLNTERSISASYMAADTFWKSEAGDAIRHIAETQPELTSMDVRRYLDEKGVKTGNLSALGAVMLSAKRAGLIKKTKRVERSNFAASHGTIRPIWKSQVYRAK